MKQHLEKILLVTNIITNVSCARQATMWFIYLLEEKYSKGTGTRILSLIFCFDPEKQMPVPEFDLGSHLSKLNSSTHKKKYNQN